MSNVGKRSTQYIVGRRGLKMVNTLLLDEARERAGKTKTYLANKLGISIQSLRLKSKNDYSFTSDEVTILCQELGIKKLSDKEKIFFARDVGKSSTTERR